MSRAEIKLAIHALQVDAMSCRLGGQMQGVPQTKACSTLHLLNVEHLILCPIISMQQPQGPHNLASRAPDPGLRGPIP